MYGLVNKAVQQLLTTKFGEAAWERIRKRAGVTQTHFISLDPYPDSITYSLVGAASEELGAPAATLLKTFGEYWVEFAWSGDYEHILNASGTDFAAFLGNLDQLHSRLRATFAEFDPPSFRLSDVSAGSMKLHYYSSRQGLLPFVEGLLHGVGARFGQEVKVEFLPRSPTADHEMMLVHWEPRSAGAA